jgi:hypothetical protein
VDSKSVNTIKGYVTAIAVHQDPVDGHPVSLHPAVVLWVKGLVRSKGLLHVLVPPWNMEIILSALKGPPFESLHFRQASYLEDGFPHCDCIDMSGGGTTRSSPCFSLRM